MFKRKLLTVGILFLAIIICIVINGCQPSLTTKTGSITSTVTNSVVVPTKTAQLTVTANPTSLFTQTVTPTKIIPLYEESCPEILPEIPLTADLNGTAVLINEINHNPSIYDFRENSLLPYSDQIYYYDGYFEYSPNGKYLAFAKEIRNSGDQISYDLIIIDEKLNTIFEKQIYFNEWTALYWLDNQRIVLGNFFDPVVLNPFTGQAYLISEWYSESPGGIKVGRLTWDVWGIYDPTLTRILYMQVDDSIILWDIQEKKTLATLTPKFPFTSSDTPKWSPDGNLVVFTYPSEGATDYSSMELFSLNREGKLTQLTYLTDLFDEVVIDEFRWSYDGTKLALIFNSSKSDDDRLAVLDIKTGMVTAYCNLPGNSGSITGPIWSPSGEQILITRFEDDESSWSTVLVDLNKGYAARLTENYRPAAWLLNEP